ncbi:MAG TPA: hypothetical protein PKX15_08750, partial [Bacteroidales bacterium]|nr:hypothetical protein [Bacteroidales bacterium]
NTTTWSATSTTPNYRAVYKYQNGSFPTSAGTNTYNRPDVRLYIEGFLSDTNSVALYNIDNPVDSVVAAPSHQVPVIVTIKNKGISNLDSCYIHWSVNGIVKPTYKWHGHLLEGYTTQQLIGYYIPSVNQYDTIIAWTSNPNGVSDATTNDDTLQKIAFGVTGLDMHFTDTYGDTVFTSGPFYITAKIKSRTLQAVQQPVRLKIAATY